MVKWSQMLGGAALRRWALGAGVLVALTACGGGGDGDGAMSASASKGPAEPVIRAESHALTVAPDPRLEPIREVTAIKSVAQDLPVVRLGPLDVPKASAQDGPLRIGAVRTVAEVEDARDLGALLRWQTGPAGRRIAAVRFESAAAEGVRLGLRVTQLPPLTLLRVQPSDGGQAVEVDGVEVLRTIQRNLDAGTPQQDARMYWLPTVTGAQVTLEIELAEGVDPATLKLAVPRLGHLWATAETADRLKIGEAASCNVDVTCTSGHQSQSAAVARMLYARGQSLYLCSGALMNDSRNSAIPYFLSANHCISTQEVASTLETYWFYRSATCNSSAVFSGMQRVGGGATLLYASSVTDTSFMRLNGSVPSGAVFAGWDASTPSGSGAVKGLHHPRGDLQKLSLGNARGFATCQDPAADGSVLCAESTQQLGTRLIALWSSGTTEGGSSGSPLFATSSGSSYVVGQLHSGAGTCETTRLGLYGRFDLAFKAALQNWLAPATTPPPTPGGQSPVYRFYNATSGAHFYTSNALERDFVIANYPVFRYEGPVFSASNQAGAGLSPVFRFYNATSGAHFYTINAAERDFVIANYPVFRYEGPTWYAQTQPGNNAIPMHRFFNQQRGTHFYTISQAEADFVRITYPVFKYEGTAYYAWGP